MYYTIEVNNACLHKSPKGFWWQSIHTFTDVFADATEYSDYIVYLKGGETVDITDRLLPIPESFRSHGSSLRD